MGDQTAFLEGSPGPTPSTPGHGSISRQWSLGTESVVRIRPLFVAAIRISAHSTGLAVGSDVWSGIVVQSDMHDARAVSRREAPFAAAVRQAALNTAFTLDEREGS